MPRTRRRSSGLRNGPSRERLSKILFANAGPIPGRDWSSSKEARFRSTRVIGWWIELEDSEWLAPVDPPPSVRVPILPGGLRWSSNGKSFEKSRKGRIFASVAGPMPGTRKRSSARVNPPPSLRFATRARAVAGPMPGSRSNSSSPLRFGSSTSPGAMGADLRACSSRASSLSSNRRGSSVSASGTTASWTRTRSTPIRRTDRANRTTPPRRRLRPSIGDIPEDERGVGRW